MGLRGNLPLHLRLARLLHEAEDAFSPDDPRSLQAFLVWWVNEGRQHHPVMARPANSGELALLAQTVAPPAPGATFALSRLMDAVWAARTDLHARFPYRDPACQTAFIQWFFCQGVPEHGLFDWLPDWQVQRLRALAQPLAGLADVPINLLHRCVLAVRDDLRQVHRLDDPAARLRFLSWYCCVGLAEMGHAPYYDDSLWRWLHSRHPRLHDLSWLDVLAWHHHHGERAPGADETGTMVDWARSRSGEEPGLAALRHARSGHDLPSVPSHPAGRPFGVNLLGPAQSLSGAGEDLRMAAQALVEAGVPCCVVPVAEAQASNPLDHSCDHLFDETAPYRYNLLCLGVLDTARLWLERGEALFCGRYTIAAWAVDLPVWPGAWDDVLELTDEIWVPTTCALRALDRHVARPVTYLPAAVSVDRLRPLPRAHFGLESGRLLVLHASDAGPGLERKNPLEAVHAFRLAFPRGDERVGLVLHMLPLPGEAEARAALRQAVADDPRIVLLERALPRDEMLGLIAACDLYLDTRRAAGFCRTMAEAMLLGKPVVGVGFAGCADLLSRETGFPVAWQREPLPRQPGLYRARPDGDALARTLRQVADGQGPVRLRAEAARVQVQFRHAPAAVGAMYARRLAELEQAVAASAPLSRVDRV